ncbi:MAG: spermine/spermidine synthase family protein [Labilithrix sp.]|nr:spermine/spermidine synthase family protein [Labilithrix sp.]
MGELLLYVTVVLVAICGLVYELVAGAVSTYLLGDSVTQLSTIIGVHLTAMGVGAWLSKYVEERVAERFIDCQIAASLVGGLGGPVLYLAFATTSHVRLVLYGMVTVTGILVGAELPLFMRVLKRRVSLRDVVPRVLSFDYVGALLGSLLFALVLLPSLGILRTGIVFGIVGVLAALWGTWVLGASLVTRPLRIRAAVAGAVLLGALVASQRIVKVADEALLLHPVAFTKQTAYQRIVLTQARSGVSLFLDGNLQFASIDEYRYHEALVHPAFAAAARHRNVLVLGGGDGLAVREILRHEDVASVTLVDLDRGMTDLARELPLLRELNERSFFDPRVKVVNDDAMVWITEPHEGIPAKFDVVIVDFPDPNNFSLGKLYTVRFYRLLRERLAEGAVMAVQSTSPLVARRSFWCVVRSIEAAGFAVRPYHALVPSFGEWGYVLASLQPVPVPSHVPPGLRYLTDATVGSLFDLAPDMSAVPVELNRLNNQMLVRYYEEEWQRWAR